MFKTHWLLGTRDIEFSQLWKKCDLNEDHPIINVWQHHSDTSIDAINIFKDTKYLQKSIPRDPSPPKGDALYYILKGNAPSGGLTLAVQTADCVPILLIYENSKNQPIAIAAIHSGWRGTIQKILPKTMNQIEAKLVQPFTKKAIIGANIEQDCYEVGEEVAKQFKDESYAEFLKKHPSDLKKSLLDVNGVIHKQLIDSGPVEITDRTHCTACHLDLYGSYRKEGHQRGRNWSLIGLIPA